MMMPAICKTNKKKVLSQTGLPGTCVYVSLSKSYPSHLRGSDSAPDVGKILFIVLQGGMNAVPQESQDQQVAGNEGCHYGDAPLASLTTPDGGSAISCPVFCLPDAHGAQGAIVALAALLAHVAGG